MRKKHERENRETRQARLDYKRGKKELQRRMHEEQYNLHRKLLRELHAMEPENRHYRRHMRDFDQYYSRMKYSRPFSILFILLLWVLLFFYGGFNTGLGIVLLVFAILSTLGYVMQSFFFSSIEKRVLKPVERLKKGVDEIANGNYEVKVDAEGAWEVQSLIRDFNTMAQKLRKNEILQAQYEENRKHLVASISHDLKTPITSILGYIEAVSDTKGLSPEKLEKYLQIIHNNIAYMNRLIDDLFLFSKLDMQKLSFDFADTPMAPFVSDIMEELGLELEEKGAALVYRDETDGSPQAGIDAKRFYQVIRNIVDNALKHGGARDLTIRARLYCDAKNVYIDIANNGAAIPEDKLGHIFDRFYRLDTARTKDIGSTGLGLAIAKELMEAHGGGISAASTDDEGTCFTVSVPLAGTSHEKKEGV